MRKSLAFLGILFFLGSLDSCTTLVTRRDLYSPEPAPDSWEAKRQWASATTTTQTTITTTQPEAPPEPMPQFR